MAGSRSAKWSPRRAAKKLEGEIDGDVTAVEEAALAISARHLARAYLAGMAAVMMRIGGFARISFRKAEERRLKRFLREKE